MKDVKDSVADESAKLLPQIPVARLTGHDGPVQDVCWHYNPHNSGTSAAKYCLTAGHDRSVRLWNPFRVDPEYIEHKSISKKQHQQPKRITTTKRLPASSPQSQQLLSQHQHMQDHQELPPALEIQKYTAGFAYEINAIAVASSNNNNSAADILLAGCKNTLHVLDMVTAKSLRKLGDHHSHNGGRINAVATYGQDIYLSGSFDTTVALWDGRVLNNRKPIQVLTDAKDSVTDVLVTVESGGSESSSSTMNHSAYFRTASVDGCVRTYDLRKGVLQCDQVGSSITSMALSKDRQCLAVSCLDGIIRLLDANSGELLNTYQGDHAAGNYGLQVDVLANDATIVSGSEDGTMVLYDLVRATSTILPGATRRPMCAIAAHPTQASTLLTASYDNRTVVWSHDQDWRWRDQVDAVMD